MKLKVGRKIIDIDKNDLILDKKLFNELKKLEFIFTSDGLKLQAEKQYGHTGLTYWKFNIDRMQKAGY